LFLFLESLAFIILIQNNRFQQANFLGAANSISGNAFETINQVSEYLALKTVNQELAEENAQLKSEQLSAYYRLTPNRILLNDSTYQLQYTYLSAKVVNNTINKRNNYAILNQGDFSGVQRGMGVVSDKGVIGIVKSTSENYAAVITLLHKNTQISAKLLKNDYFGLVGWNGKDYRIAQLSDIPSHVDIKVGDTVVTRGSGAIFPPDIMLGRVLSFEEIEGTDFYDIEIELSVDFKNLSHVYVVENKFKWERDSLVNSIEE
jgi:rod shape-determining protein MreC